MRYPDYLMTLAERVVATARTAPGRLADEGPECVAPVLYLALLLAGSGGDGRLVRATVRLLARESGRAPRDEARALRALSRALDQPIRVLGLRDWRSAVRALGTCLGRVGRELGQDG